MSHGVVIEIDKKDLERLGDKLNKCPNITRKAMAYALNRAMSKGITYTANEVKKEYPSIKRKDISQGSKKTRATIQKLNASVEFKGPRLQASKFPHTISRRKQRSPVTLKIKNAKQISGANPIMFGEKAGGKRGARGTREVFKREPSSRVVKTVYTLSVPQMISNENAIKKIESNLHKDYMDRFEHELEYRLGLLDKE